MAKLSDFKRNTKAIQDGVWIRVNQAEYGDLEIRTRGYTDAFIDAQAARQRRLAAPYGGDTSAIPNAEMRQLNAELLREFLILEVRNLRNEDGTDVTLDEFLKLLDDPDFALLAQASFQAANRVTRQSAAQVAAAEGNLETASVLH